MDAQRPGASLVALVRAGPYRLALPAEAVVQVARLEPEVHAPALLEAFGEPAPARGTWGIVLDGPERRTYRVDAVEGIRERGAVRVFNLPEGVGVAPPELVSGVLPIDGALALELRPGCLAGLGPRPPAPSRAPRGLTEPAPTALLATISGRQVGFALPHVLGVVGQPGVCPVPRAAPGVRGVAEHGQTLYPALDLGALHFDRPASGELGVLVEQQGRAAMVLVDAVLGMRHGFRPMEGAEPGWMEGGAGEQALFLRVDSA